MNWFILKRAWNTKKKCITCDDRMLEIAFPIPVAVSQLLWPATVVKMIGNSWEAILSLWSPVFLVKMATSKLNDNPAILLITIDPACPLEWLENHPAPHTVGSISQVHHTIKMLLTPNQPLDWSCHVTLNWHWINFKLQSPQMFADRTDSHSRCNNYWKWSRSWKWRNLTF